MKRLGDLAALLLGCSIGMLLPPALQRAATAAAAAVVVLSVLAVLAHVCGRRLRPLFTPAHPARARRVLAPLPPRPTPLPHTPSARRLLAWLARRRPDSHTRAPRPARRTLPDGRTQQPASPPLRT